ncbi:hypothetical protein PsYK624_073330 [Phanerochaete sordida]|uniref:EF-hand domain-containing protein n=1 Tax=Phanerochaete sordida TaxID=48140 RepID=A0A9P3GB85_9APHY|nr:hypothetical protein PsYK624_073330 [Phanerochaete sordida]
MEDTSYEITSAQVALDSLATNISASRPKLENLVTRTDGTVDGFENAAQSDLVAQLGGIVKFTADNVHVNLQTLVDALDVVSTIHPFVAVAAIAFKAAIKMEVTRRMNDQRMLQLHANMCNMMHTVAWLGDFERQYIKGQETIDLEDRVGKCMTDIAADIRECTKSCILYQSRVLIARVLSGSQWEKKLSDFSARFYDHETKIDRLMSQISALKSSRSYAKLVDVDQKVDQVLLFASLRPQEDRKLQEFVEDHGGLDVVLKDESLRGELEGLIEENETSREDRLASAISDELGQDFQSTMQKLFNENQQTFDEHFRTHWDTLLVTLREENVGGKFRKELQDDDIRTLWTDMGWGGQVPADTLVLQLLRFAAEQLRPLQNASALHSNADSWAKYYLAREWKQGLLEAIDFDGSGSVNIEEMNTFSALRPQDSEIWSLPHWLAYWTVGRLLVMKRYYSTISEQLDRIRAISARALPVNRAFIQKLLGEGVFYACDCILAGVHGATKGRTSGEAEAAELIFEKFKGRVHSEEHQLRQLLQSVNYELDTCTIPLVVGHRRVDTTVLPLLYLLLEQTIKVIHQASTAALDRQQVLGLRASLWTLLRISYQRVEARRDMLITKSYNEAAIKRDIKAFALGLYYYVYCYDELANSSYLREQMKRYPDYITADFAGHRVKEIWCSSPGSLGTAWTYADIQEIVTNPAHDMHHFLHLCVEQGVMSRDGEPIDVFMKMARQAISKATRRGVLSAHTTSSGSPSHRISSDLARTELLARMDRVSRQTPADMLQLCCALVDNIIRRQIVHSPVKCDSCKKRTIHMTRLVCLICIDDSDEAASQRGRTTDYCTRCLFDKLQLRCSVSEHEQHSFLQVRRFTYNKWDHTFLTEARSRWEEQVLLCGYGDLWKPVTNPRRTRRRQTGSALICQSCQGPVGSSFWFCLDCRAGRVYVCHRCNADDKQINLHLLEDMFAEQLSESKSSEHETGDLHRWWHSLILVVNPRAGDSEALPPTSQVRQTTLADLAEQPFAGPNTSGHSWFPEPGQSLSEPSSDPIFNRALTATPTLIMASPERQPSLSVEPTQVPGSPDARHAHEDYMRTTSPAAFRSYSRAVDQQSFVAEGGLRSASPSAPGQFSSGRQPTRSWSISSAAPVIPEDGRSRDDSHPILPPSRSSTFAARSPSPGQQPGAHRYPSVSSEYLRRPVSPYQAHGQPSQAHPSPAARQPQDTASHMGYSAPWQDSGYVAPVIPSIDPNPPPSPLSSPHQRYSSASSDNASTLVNEPAFSLDARLRAMESSITERVERTSQQYYQRVENIAQETRTMVRRLLDYRDQDLYTPAPPAPRPPAPMPAPVQGFVPYTHQAAAPLYSGPAGSHEIAPHEWEMRMNHAMEIIRQLEFRTAALEHQLANMRPDNDRSSDIDIVIEPPSCADSDEFESPEPTWGMLDPDPDPWSAPQQPAAPASPTGNDGTELYQYQYPEPVIIPPVPPPVAPPAPLPVILESPNEEEAQSPDEPSLVSPVDDRGSENPGEPTEVAETTVPVAPSPEEPSLASPVDDRGDGHPEEHTEVTETTVSPTSSPSSVRPNFWTRVGQRFQTRSRPLQGAPRTTDC